MGSDFDKLIELFSKFPGIGPRQARRFVYAILRRNPSYAEELATAIVSVRKEMGQCDDCYRYFPAASSSQCDICANPNTSGKSLLIVEKDADLENVHRAGLHDGHYFVLGGLVPILEREPEKKVRISELRKRLSALPELSEMILALSVNPVGDNTIDYLKESLTDVIDEKSLKVSLLGRGLSTGTELEYSDADTLRHALENRS